MTTGTALSTCSIPYGNATLDLRFPQSSRVETFSPHPVSTSANALDELRRALAEPIGSPPLADAVGESKKILILADDLTRRTPVMEMVSLLLDELHGAGKSWDQISVVIALGTHRPMSEKEIEERFGAENVKKVRIYNNPWQEPSQLADLGLTENGTPVSVSRSALEADFIIGLGSIVPHHIPGYSGGAKIVQPGISGPRTTGATHFFSTKTASSYLGKVDSLLRSEMETIAERVGLSTIFNTVLDAQGRLVRAFYGHPKEAFREGVETSREVYGFEVQGLFDLVIAGSHPCDIEFWQAHKSLYPAEAMVKPGGAIIVATPCPEGVSVTHKEMLEFTHLPSGMIQKLVEEGTIADVVSGALALAWAKIRERVSISLVSDGIKREEAQALGFTPFDSIDDALASALGRMGRDIRIGVLTHAPEMLPVFSS